MKSLLTILVFWSTVALMGQNFSSSNPTYVENVQAGEAALNAMKYDSCLIYYKTAFAIKQTSYLSTLRMAACAYQAKAEKLYLEQLDKAIAINWDGTRQIFYNYSEFQFLLTTPFETALMEKWSEAAEASGIDLQLREELAQIRILDQEQRQYTMELEWGSPEMDSIWAIQSRHDSINTDRIVEIIEAYGYPGRSLVGPDQASTAFLVIQHANLEVQEKYLPLLKAAAADDELSWSSVALLIDRVNLGQGKKQIYGSQVTSDNEGNHYFLPIEQPYQVDSIRATVGLGPLSDYAAYYQFEWNPAAHVERHKDWSPDK